jgi:hypothetical protein
MFCFGFIILLNADMMHYSGVSLCSFKLILKLYLGLTEPKRQVTMHYVYTKL